MTAFVSTLLVLVAILAAGVTWLIVAQRRTARSILAVLAEFAEGVNRADLEMVNNLMLPERRESRNLDRFTAEFSDHIVRLAPLRTQITLVRPAEGQPYNGLAKIQVRVEQAGGVAGNAIFLMARTGRRWQISDWAPGADFDLVDYGLG